MIATERVRLQKDLTLLYEVTKANFKLQNENSYLGVVWYLLGPLLLFGILLYVFSHRLGANIEHYPLYLLMGIITWNFFATGTGRSVTIITGNAAIIKSLPVRIELLVAASLLHTLVSHILEIVIFIGLLLWYGISLSLFPLYLVVLFLSFLFTFGMGLMLASVYVFLRDVQQIWSVLTRVWWFATPIFYAPTATGLGQKISLWNPMYYSIYLPRTLLIYNTVPPLTHFIVFAAFATGTLLVGFLLFTRLRPHFVPLL